MKSKFNPIIIAFAIPLVAVVLALVFIFMKKTKISSSIEFPVAAFCENPQSLFGNKYTLSAEIDSRIAVSETSGQILSVRSLSGSKLAVYIPTEFKGDIHVGQKYNLFVEISESGQIVVMGLEKY